jgi:hypothetical protein
LQAFKYGQLLLTQRETQGIDRTLKATTAVECYKVAMNFLSEVGDNQVSGPYFDSLLDLV